MNKTFWQAGATLAALSTVAFSSIGCVDRAQQAAAKATEKLTSDQRVPVSTAGVTMTSLDDTLSITGNLTTASDASVGAKQTAKIAAVYVKDGDTVTAGELIARQDTTALQASLENAVATMSNAQSSLSQAVYNQQIKPAQSRAQVRQAQAQVASAKASLAKLVAGARPEERAQTDAQVAAAKTNLDIAQKDLTRKQNLVNEGALAKTDLDTAQNTYAAALQQYNNALQNQNINNKGSRVEDLDVARAAVLAAQDNLASAKATQSLDVTLGDAVAGARAQVEAAKAQVDLARANLSDADIRAPFAGQVSGNPIQVGAIASATTVVARIIGGSGAYFEGQVPEEQIDAVKPGVQTLVTVDSMSGKTYQGVVAAVNPLGATVGRLFKVRIQLKGDLAGLQPNMFARGTLILKHIPNATVVPTNAVVTRNGKTVVYTIVSNKAKSIPVTTGLTKGENTQVMGLDTGTVIVVSGQNGLQDGSEVVQSTATKSSTDSAAPQES